MNTPLNHIKTDLHGHPWTNQVHYYEEIDSTNNLAKAMAAQGAPAGTILIADRQSAGRGRLGRSFLSPAGMGIYLSIILRPNCKASEIMHLTCAAAVAACNAVESALGFRPGIKWTNDLVYNGRKLGGILTELSIDPKTHQVDYAVIGIGLNCCQEEGDFDESIRSIACSAQMATGHPVDRERITARLILALSDMDSKLLTHSDAMLAQYRRDCITLGKQVSIVRGSQIDHAVAVDIDHLGALIVRYEDGSLDTINSGEVSIRGLYGYV